MKTIDVKNMMINIPNDYQVLDSMPEDPEHSVPLGYATSSSQDFVMIFPIAAASAMPFDYPEAVVNGIHNALGDDQGLIEVENGITRAGKKYIYSIVKSKMEPTGMQYIFTFHLYEGEGNVINIQGYFSEAGTTGMRDTIGYELMVREGKVKAGSMDGWFEDPYDKEYKKGLPMNLSENKAFDEMFPEHPLSVGRDFCKFIIENN